MKEYVVTTRRGVDISEIDFELYSEQGSDTIPHRSVDIANPRQGSRRNTHWWLTDEEAQKLKLDPRILDVELTIEQCDDVVIEFDGIQNSMFTQNPHTTLGGTNWGLLRGSHRENPFKEKDIRTDLRFALDGTGVDIVIQDSGIEVDHPEFLDSEGNSRIQQIDWYKESGISGKQAKTFYKDVDGHGTHVASTAAGLYYGWAKNARIFSQKFVGPNSFHSGEAFDILRLWHEKKNTPTVVNMSWSIKRKITNPIIHGMYRGETFDINKIIAQNPKTYKDILREEYSLACIDTVPNQVSHIQADIEELIDAGVHICHSAGNDSFYIVDEDSEDFNNALYIEITTAAGSFKGRTFTHAIPYNKPSSPYHRDAITVGSLDTTDDRISKFSRTGPAVDIYAPGYNIIGAIPAKCGKKPKYEYPIDETYRSAVMTGTSMSTPQVTGVAALHLQANPHLSPRQLKERLLQDSTISKHCNLLYNRYNTDSFNMKG